MYFLRVRSKQYRFDCFIQGISVSMIGIVQKEGLERFRFQLLNYIATDAGEAYVFGLLFVLHQF